METIEASTDAVRTLDDHASQSCQQVDLVVNDKLIKLRELLLLLQEAE